MRLLIFFKILKFITHLHIPLQSGSDKILKMMRRKYDVSTYASKSSKISSTIKDCTIGVDVMVGFPGESEQDFNDFTTYYMIYQFHILNVFPFSERKTR